MNEMRFPDADPEIGGEMWVRSLSARDYVEVNADSIWLDRPTVEVLRDWLTIWLEEER